MEHVINAATPEQLEKLKEEHEFLMTPEQLEFFMDASKEYVMINVVKNASEEGHFKFLCDKMLASNDPEIRVNMSRVMMYMGFQSLLQLVSKGISEVIDTHMMEMMSQK